jgi:HSP20 family protein
MADTKVQNRTSEEQNQNTQQPGRGLARRQESGLGSFRDPFYFSPFSMMRRLSEEMDRAFSSSFGFGGDSGRWSPALDVRERGGNLEICAELPGMSKDDVKVECTNEGIVIEGEKRREEQSNQGGYHRSERSYGHFYRMIPLPEGADAEKATAEFKDGVLHVKVPVPTESQNRRQIPIKS